MAVPLLDLTRQYIQIKEKIDSAIQNVFKHGLFILGPEVDSLEKRIASYCQAGYGVGVASGTDALLLSLKAAGINPGDEVITPNFSFFASTSVINRAGASPVFVDIEEDTYNIDPEKVEAAITPRTRAIIIVHLFGQMADMNPLMEIARANDLTIIEDAAQAIGSKYRGRPAGSLGDFGCFSFFPSKNLGAAGDGGMLVTNSIDNYENLRMWRQHGWKKKYRPEKIGYNSRLATIQAAVLLVKLDYLDEWHEKRRKHAAIYDKAFAGTSIKIPIVRDYAYHIYHQYTIAVENRDELIEVLKERKIGHDVYYPIPFHKLECYREMKLSRGDYPVSEKASENLVSIPVFPDMLKEEQEEVIEIVRSVSA